MITLTPNTGYYFPPDFKGAISGGMALLPNYFFEEYEMSYRERRPITVWIIFDGGTSTPPIQSGAVSITRATYVGNTLTPEPVASFSTLTEAMAYAVRELPDAVSGSFYYSFHVNEGNHTLVANGFDFGRFDADLFINNNATVTVAAPATSAPLSTFRRVEIGSYAALYLEGGYVDVLLQIENRGTMIMSPDVRTSVPLHIIGGANNATFIALCFLEEYIDPFFVPLVNASNFSDFENYASDGYVPDGTFKWNAASNTWEQVYVANYFYNGEWRNYATLDEALEMIIYETTDPTPPITVEIINDAFFWCDYDYLGLADPITAGEHTITLNIQSGARLFVYNDFYVAGVTGTQINRGGQVRLLP
jgi:hypothetical protein